MVVVNLRSSEATFDNTRNRLTHLIKHTWDKTTKTDKWKSKEETIPHEILELLKFKNKIKWKWQRLRRPADRDRHKDQQITIRTRLEHRCRTWDDKANAMAEHMTNINTKISDTTDIPTVLSGKHTNYQTPTPSWTKQTRIWRLHTKKSAT